MSSSETQEELPLGYQGNAWLPDNLRSFVGVILPEELAPALKVTLQTLAVWRSAKEGPDYVKLGKNVFYRLEDVRAWVAKNVIAVPGSGN